MLIGLPQNDAAFQQIQASSFLPCTQDKTQYIQCNLTSGRVLAILSFKRSAHHASKLLGLQHCSDPVTAVLILVLTL